ncbi:putative transmembrane protein [Leptomonas seymouri]|uniref:Putative transmembrane protein n=1 Tax=Leptomonas seymouri TaxID=5684 RepID=A0A0N1P9U7_LEPSE|nr:putative transmembrane protein [Leptomonas seymouri]|eukprot:KPI83533.1 putative transmembrane protein [Leptomonas seymouri]
MLSPSCCGASSKQSCRSSHAFMLLGVVAILLNFSVVIYLFSEKPMQSEEEEIIDTATSNARQSMMSEWIPADAKLSQYHAEGTVIKRKELLSLYRLRTIVVASEAEIPKLSRLLASLTGANYSNRRFPIDLELHILGKASRLPKILWAHGRYDVYVHRMQGSVNLSLSSVFTDVWQPQSNFELGMPLAASVELSQNWFQWVMQVIQQYSSASKDNDVHLKRAADGTLLSCALSQSMSGIALGSPVAGTTGNALFTVFSPLPSAITVFTASYWRALLAHADTGVNVEGVANATWKALLRASAVRLSKASPPFLYPPLAKIGPLACEAEDKTDAAPCSVMDSRSTIQLEVLRYLPASVDTIPSMQGQ